MKKLLSTLLMLCMVLTLLPGTAWAEDTSGPCGDDVTWSYSDGTLTVQGTGSMDDYYINDSISLLPWSDCLRQTHTIIIENGVTRIGAGVFWTCGSLRSVTIPDSVTGIGPAAFWCCRNLLGVTIPESVTDIGEQAFAQCELLRSVTIPSGVTSINWGTFSGCVSLTSVTIPSSVTSISDYAFAHCDSLNDVYYSGSESQLKQISIGSNNDPLLNATIHCSDTDSGRMPTPALASAVVLSPQKLTVDGRSVDCEKYNIDGANYFKLRDLAYLLNGTASQFGVGFDAESSTVTITTGAAYTPNNTELLAGADNSGTAQTSRQTIFIDGVKRGDLTVYNIGGSNFFQLRELGTALNFEVDYEAASNTAIVRSRRGEAPAVTEAPDPAPAAEAKLTNGKAITDENIQEILYGLKSGYSEGMRWTNDYYYYSEVLRTTGYGCEGFALICSDTVFGDLPISSEHSDFAAVKVGDLLRVNNDTHTVIVLEKRQDSVIVAEGNYNSQIHWGREISRQSLEAGNFTVRSRYPVL